MGNPDGYLNKKSWHPGSKKNLERVWKLEEDEKSRRREEAERAEQVKEERDWERAHNLTRDEAAKRRGGVAWMYQSGPPVSAKPNTEERNSENRKRPARDDPARAEERLAKVLDGIRSGIASCRDEPGGHGYEYVGVGFEDEEDEADAFRLSQVPEAERRKELRRIQRKRKKKARREKEEARRARVADAQATLQRAGML